VDEVEQDEAKGTSTAQGLDSTFNGAELSLRLALRKRNDLGLLS